MQTRLPATPNTPRAARLEARISVEQKALLQQAAALTGRTERGAEVELLNVGDVAAIEGICQGLKDGSILITRCKVAGLK